MSLITQAVPIEKGAASPPSRAAFLPATTLARSERCQALMWLELLAEGEGKAPCSGGPREAQEGAERRRYRAAAEGPREGEPAQSALARWRELGSWVQEDAGGSQGVDPALRGGLRLNLEQVSRIERSRAKLVSL
ncbi:hypothetical protein chiPu_0002655 [Chiloscyllium punctatum]|uniref:Uncharacterized protein n=1 Tax=Chiloscyllium punctatum TaxID=137246 RepID=A0A401S1J0_CHIPU|nr:hypothetical protein [Chiloscyllium punctatum]